MVFWLSILFCRRSGADGGCENEAEKVATMEEEAEAEEEEEEKEEEVEGVHID